LQDIQLEPWWTYSPAKTFHGYSHIAGVNDKSNRSPTVNPECRDGAYVIGSARVNKPQQEVS